MSENENENENEVEEMPEGVPELDPTVEAIDTAFDENGIDIVDVVTQTDPQKIVMQVRSSIHPEAEQIQVTMNFKDDSPTTLDFAGPDEYSEEEGKQVLEAVMQSLVTLLDSMADAQVGDTVPNENSDGETETSEEV